ncbi:hypothetical protein PINS_up021999 [Pythium insidiosum]|nr:hypothetical protein PINS_up021999 [Pythium insidiosum]
MIGCGGFGHVMVARHRATGQLVAIKTLSKKALASQNQVQHSKAERHVLTLCRHTRSSSRSTPRSRRFEHLHLVLDYWPPAASSSSTSRASAAFKEAPGGVLRGRGAARARASAPQQHHLPRPQARERAARQLGHVRLADFGLSKIGVDDWSLAHDVLRLN